MAVGRWMVEVGGERAQPNLTTLTADWVLRLFINISKNPELQKKDRNYNALPDSCWAILACLRVTDSLISQIFHHTQPIGTFAQISFICTFLGSFYIPYKYCPEAIH
jgi:hypothetical protein